MALKANALTTLATVKSHLGIKADDVSQDTRLELFINAASQAIETYTDRILVSQGSIVELQHGRRSNLILVRQFPIIAVSELRIDQDGLFTDPDTIIDAASYTVADDKNSVLYLGNIFPNGYNNVRVTYTAGYTTIPSDLELACVWLTEWFYLHKNRGDMGRTTASKGDESVGVLASVPPMIIEMIDSYRRIDVPSLASPVRNL